MAERTTTTSSALKAHVALNGCDVAVSEATNDVAITLARADDLDEVMALLGRVDLPLDGVREHLDGFVVVRDELRQLLGCAGLERHGSVGLLRSVAVSPTLQRSGLGSRLVAATLEHAARAGIEEVVLLTTTARDYFVERFGFAPAERALYEERLAASPEWRLPRCSSAAFLRLELSGKGCSDR